MGCYKLAWTQKKQFNTQMSTASSTLVNTCCPHYLSVMPFCRNCTACIYLFTKQPMCCSLSSHPLAVDITLTDLLGKSYGNTVTLYMHISGKLLEKEFSNKSSMFLGK